MYIFRKILKWFLGIFFFLIFLCIFAFVYAIFYLNYKGIDVSDMFMDLTNPNLIETSTGYMDISDIETKVVSKSFTKDGNKEIYELVLYAESLYCNITLEVNENVYYNVEKDDIVIMERRTHCLPFGLIFKVEDSVLMQKFIDEKFEEINDYKETFND